MKSLNAFALFFILTTLPVAAQIGPDGTEVVNGYQIGPGANLSGVNLTGVIRFDAILAALITELETQLAATIAERDARPTLDQVQDARVGSIVMAKDPQTGVVTLCFNLQKTDDFISWIAYGGGTLNDLGKGQFKVSLPLGPGKEWLRMVMKE
jgi:hypothetical protein